LREGGGRRGIEERERREERERKERREMGLT
jgi:hypothetical protein